MATKKIYEAVVDDGSSVRGYKIKAHSPQVAACLAAHEHFKHHRTDVFDDLFGLVSVNIERKGQRWTIKVKPEVSVTWVVKEGT